MGVQIQGDTGNVIATKGTYSGNVTIGGTLTYEDVTNIDSVGLITARQGIEVGASPGVAASISVDGNMIVSGITTIGGDIKVGSGVTIGKDGHLFATGVTTSTTVKVGAAVTISESGIEASGIGITVANINRGQISGRRNIIINGAAMVAQRGDTLSGTTTGGYATDRFEAVQNETGTITVSQDSDAPAGFKKCHRLTQTTAQGSLAANDLTTFRYNAEGYDLQGFKKGTSGAEEFTVSFWVKSIDQSSYPVTYILELRDPVNTRSCCKAYTVSASDTWEYKTITFPADSSGQWATDNSKSLEMNWFCAAGSNYTGGTLSTSWATTVTANRAAGLTANLSANTANRFFLTGVQLEVGSQATAFEYRSFQEELALCQRYYQRHSGGALSYFGSGNIDGANQAQILVNFITEMRTTPSLETTGTASDYFIRVTTNATCTSVPILSNRNTKNALVEFYSSSHGFTSGHACFGRRANVSDSYLGFNAELS